MEGRFPSFGFGAVVLLALLVAAPAAAQNNYRAPAAKLVPMAILPKPEARTPAKAEAPRPQAETPTWTKFPNKDTAVNRQDEEMGTQGGRAFIGRKEREAAERAAERERKPAPPTVVVPMGMPQQQGRGGRR